MTFWTLLRSAEHYSFTLWQWKESSSSVNPHRVPWCGLLWVRCRRWEWVLSSTPSPQCPSLCPECNRTGPLQSHISPGETSSTVLEQEQQIDFKHTTLETDFKGVFFLYWTITAKDCDTKQGWNKEQVSFYAKSFYTRRIQTITCMQIFAPTNWEHTIWRVSQRSID